MSNHPDFVGILPILLENPESRPICNRDRKVNSRELNYHFKTTALFLCLDTNYSMFREVAFREHTLPNRQYANFYLLLQKMVQTRRHSLPLNISNQNKTFGKKFQPQHTQRKQNPQTQGSQSFTPPYYPTVRKVMRDPARRYLKKERQPKSDQPAKEPGLNNGNQQQQNQLMK